MGLRFRRSVRLFPGVRLNFSRSGISTTIGVRGAGITLGPHGTYANVGLPGTGISYRTRISGEPGNAYVREPGLQGDQPSPFDHFPEVPTPPMAPPSSGGQEIHSGSVSAMTSPGLNELKRLINEAAMHKTTLTGAVADGGEELRVIRRKLAFAKGFIIRLFTRSAVLRLETDVRDSQAKLDETRSELDGCYINIDFGLDDASTGTFAALCRSFEALSGCQRIWDITESAKTDRIKERTTATTRVNRTLVEFGFSEVDILHSDYRSMRLRNASSFELHLFPGFILTKEIGSDFALVEWRELSVESAVSRFIETEQLPGDSEVVGHTWAKANKDGSPDRRFSDNYQIPIAKYGELWLRSPTGIYEAYTVSNFPKTEDFAAAILHHKEALARIEQIPRETISEVVEPQSEAPPTPTSPPAQVQHPFYLDWATLVIVILALIVGGHWVSAHGKELLEHMFAAKPITTSGPIVQATPEISQRPSVFVTAREINVRDKPATSASVVRKTARGTKLSVFQVRGRWTQIGGERPVGWVLSKFVNSAPIGATSAIGSR
jgi:hypothetical protein